MNNYALILLVLAVVFGFLTIWLLLYLHSWHDKTSVPHYRTDHALIELQTRALQALVPSPHRPKD